MINQKDIYSILLSPHVTEKTTMLSSNNAVVFKVRIDSTKKSIKHAVETIYGVSVKSVNTLVVKGKRKNFKGRVGCRSDYKKAVVALAEGAVIDVMQPV